MIEQQQIKKNLNIIFFFWLELPCFQIKMFAESYTYLSVNLLIFDNKSFLSLMFLSKNKKKTSFFLYLNMCHCSWNNPYCSSIESHELIFLYVLYFEITSCLLLWISAVVIILMFRWQQRFIPNSYQSRLLMFHVKIIWVDTKSRSWNQKKKCNNKNSIIILFQWKL